MQPIRFLLVLLVTSISLTGCHAVAGNVIPQSGPTMEHIYDSMGHSQPSVLSTDSAEADLSELRKTKSTTVSYRSTNHVNTATVFRKLPNPELKLYVYPHFAGEEEVPIPGYYTQINAYERTHYALPSDITG